MKHEISIYPNHTYAAECSCDWEGQAHTLHANACNEGQEHVREMHAKLLREAVVDAFHANGLIVSGTEVEMIVKAAIEVGT